VLVAAILHGSLTMNDFRPESSDLDLLLVVDFSLASSDADALIRAVRAAHLGPAGGVDLLVVTRRTAESPGSYPSRELAVGRWPGHGEELEIEGPEDHVPDLWPELSGSAEWLRQDHDVARAHGHRMSPEALAGERTGTGSRAASADPDAGGRDCRPLPLARRPQQTWGIRSTLALARVAAPTVEAERNVSSSPVCEAASEVRPRAAVLRPGMARHGHHQDRPRDAFPDGSRGGSNSRV
jgi:hypothetical protein